eukprot:GHVT01006839.1.p1 GENE.GHVT01006839.1~~GHVT01006839.1.p1  ORF type:complete len:249 (-),score=11.69 GHVT01006839.1:34-780(-)
MLYEDDIKDSDLMTCEGSGVSVIGKSFRECTIVPQSNNWKAILGVGIPAIVSIVAVIFLIWKRDFLLVVYHDRRGRLNQVRADDEDKYDAYISYCSRIDLGKVKNILIPALEEAPPHYSLCIPDRDWLIGGYIAEDIINSINTSRATVILLSQAYVQDQWCMFEFQQAHAQFIVDNNAKLIIVLMEDGLPQTNNLMLKAHLQFHTYLRWDEFFFWPRLRHSLKAKGQQEIGPRRRPRKDTEEEERFVI